MKKPMVEIMQTMILNSNGRDEDGLIVNLAIEFFFPKHLRNLWEFTLLYVDKCSRGIDAL